MSVIRQKCLCHVHVLRRDSDRQRPETVWFRKYRHDESNAPIASLSCHDQRHRVSMAIFTLSKVMHLS